MKNLKYSKFALQVIISFLLIMLVTRICLITQSIFLDQINFNIFEISKILLLGELNDLSTLFYILTPISIIYLLLPTFLLKTKISNLIGKLFIFAYIYGLLFNLVAEYFFWDEFGVRYNFIAVDYLVYRREVTGNIYESYPLIKILIAIAICVPIIYFFISFLTKRFNFKNFPKFFIIKTSILLILFLSASYYFNPKNFTYSKFSNNNYAANLSYNGLDKLFSAYNNNILSYKDFYINYNKDKILKNLRDKLLSKNSTYISNELTNITRNITPADKNKHKYNIALVLVESLSAEYLKYFDNNENITPFLDNLTSKSIFFDNFYATGTRTVRGLEAISLSLPPLPGNSIVRLPNNQNLFSIGSVFKNSGYENKFIYGGFGYFDNMNAFFSKNNFKIVDRANFSKEEINFSNIWGVSDEDLFNKFISEADKSYNSKTPFFSFILTTSNHRPYTYPENKIDIPSGTGRAGAVKYTDFAIQQLINNSKNKPWFDDTIFVIVADHCAGSAGKTQIPVQKYHIPLFIYAPKILKPEVIHNLSSQIDIAPTLMGILNIPYESKFFGKDIINSTANRAFVSTYQKVGYFSNNQLTILGPKESYWSYKVDQNFIQKPNTVDQNHLFDAVTFYQSASYLLNNNYLKE